MKKVIFSSIAALFAAICPAATTYNLANGNVTVPANMTATITQSNSRTATGNTITINEGATVTLQGINIQSKWAPPISCVGSSTIIIADGSSNTVTSTSAYYAAIYAGSPGSTLTIKGGSAGTGILVADSTLQGGGAGIGASYGNSPSGCGNIVIEGGVIRAMSENGAGIGGSDDAKSGDITIKGGNVLATSIEDNSGIGGGAGNITISGGTVVARGGRLCAGIGSGRSGGGDSSEVGNITISGGTVHATGGGGAAGIGSGRGHVCGAISITGGNVVATAVTDQYFSGQAGIGAGDSGKVNGNITIGNGIIKVVATVVKSSAAHINLGTSSTGSVSLNSKLKQVKSNNNLTLTLTPTYTIAWKNENGTTLETDSRVDRGVVPTYNGATPTKASTAQYSYTFKGWSPTVAAATADKTYTATYNATVRSYKVTWKDDDGTTLRVDSVQYGTSPGYGEEPTRGGYAFDGWFTAAEGGDLLSEGTIVTKDMSFFAHWKRSSFLAGEDVACAGVNVTLASAQAEWLNGLGDYETVKAAVAAMGADKFEEAYLLNLDLTNAERGYAFEVVGIDARGADVVVTARLVRSGAVQSSGGKNAPINGVLRLYGSKTPEKNGFAPMADAVVSDATFASGETATLTLSKSGENRFFHAVIAAP